jgi:hypothetical protein
LSFSALSFSALFFSALSFSALSFSASSAKEIFFFSLAGFEFERKLRRLKNNDLNSFYFILSYISLVKGQRKSGVYEKIKFIFHKK